MIRLAAQDARRLAERALLGAGASEAAASTLADATVAAELAGRSAVGFAHLIDYLDSLRAGRIDGAADPDIRFPAPAIIQIDARGGIAQLGFDRAFGALCDRAGSFGVAILSQSNAYSCGELGHYTRRIAHAGFVALAATNGSAHVAAGKSRSAVYGTNPLSFAAPVADGPPLLIDQASSAAAFVTVRRAAEAGAELPAGWAIDAGGDPTTDARAAMRGALLAFGGRRGANIALMVEVMAAGLTGACWSVDSPSFTEGEAPLDAGLLVIALAPDILAPGLATRLSVHLDRLSAQGIHVPGRSVGNGPSVIELDRPLVDAIERFATGG
jgi:(2R)-3-sulfolactate dehydrogenase (NADP+)